MSDIIILFIRTFQKTLKNQRIILVKLASRGILLNKADIITAAGTDTG
jgi:hypothetical protein